MDSLKQKSRTHNGPLTYGLRSSVRCHRLPDGKMALVLGYPLRTVFIHDFWQPVVNCLAHGQRVSLDRVCATVPQISSHQIELFLNALVRKGYIDQEGYPRLDYADYPKVTVIVPVRNRPGEINACLKSLTGLNYPADKLEIIVVDDASDDATPDIVMGFPDVRLMRMTQHRHASFCRNRAADIAAGDILAFVDSDCQVTATWLNELVPAFRDPTVGALGGLVESDLKDNCIDRYEKVKSALKIGSLFKRSDQAERFFYVPACNFLVRREVFQRLGGFRESMQVGEDVDLCWRLQDEGYALEYRPMGRVAHKHRNRIRPFCSRRFDYGTSEPALQQIHTDRVKTLYLPWNESIFWSLMTLFAVLASSLLLLAAAGLLLVDCTRKYLKLKSRQVPVGRLQVFTAVLRGYLSFVHHLCSFISRYYLVAVPVILLLSPTVAGVMVGMHLTAGLVEFIVKKPRMYIWTFLIFFTLEQLSYQSGVWWACIQMANFKSVMPRVVHTRVQNW